MTSKKSKAQERAERAAIAFASFSSGANPGSRIRARSTNKRNASKRIATSGGTSVSSGTIIDGTRHVRSPATPNGSRLVARICTAAPPRRMRSTNPAAAATTCSQLSRTNSSRRAAR